MPNLKDILKKHIVDTTAILTASNPIFSLMETQLSGMSDQVSINARLISALQLYAGMGFAYSKGRDLTRKVFKITDTTPEKVQQLCDAIYSAGYNALLAPIMYSISGEHDVKKIAIGTASAIGFGILFGSPMGYAIDTFRDFTGIQKSERLPNILKGKNASFKLGVAGAATAGSIGLMDIIYRLTP